MMLQPLSIPALAARIATREISCERLIRETLDRISRLNPTLNAYITVLGDRALEDARRLDDELASGRYRGPLHGLPISVKDLIDVQGAPTTAASRVREGHVAACDAPVVARLREAGAVIIGKTNLHEFAYGTTSEDSAYGPVRNAWNPNRLAGGSSGGSATAIAAGLCAGSIGTDTGGSIRIPSAACGCVGLKPTYAELPADGVVPLSWSLDHVGPMAADIESVEELYRGAEGAGGARGAGDDGSAARSGQAVLLADENNARSGLGAGGTGDDTSARSGLRARGMRFGVPRRYFMDLVDAEVRARFTEALGRLRAAGATVVDVEIPHAELIAAVYLHIQLPESSCYHAPSLERVPELYLPSVRLRLEMGRYVRAEDYVRAQRGREVLRQEVDRALSGVHALALPTLPIPAPALGQAMVRVERQAASGDAVRDVHAARPGEGVQTEGEMSEVEMPVRAMMLRLTQLFNITGHPAISLPMGVTGDRLPTGLQLVGRRGSTRALLACARRVAATA